MDLADGTVEALERVFPGSRYSVWDDAQRLWISVKKSTEGLLMDGAFLKVSLLSSADLQSTPSRSLLDVIQVDLYATAERARSVIKVLEERRRQLVRAHGSAGGRRKRRRIFDQGWHFLPEPYIPSQTDAPRLLPLEVKGVEGNSVGVCVMGRKAFKKVRQQVTKLRKMEMPGGLTKLLIHGPKGTGKTHLVTQLVMHLAEELKAEGKRMRVAPIFDCATLRAEEERVSTLRHALAWAFWDCEEQLSKIATLSSMKAVWNFLEGREHQLIWVLDQYQTLDGYRAVKMEVESLLRGFPNVVVTSGGAEELNNIFMSGHVRAVFLPILGLEKEELPSFNLVYGTDCKTPGVLQRLSEDLEGNPGALVDFHRCYYGKLTAKDRLSSVIGPAGNGLLAQGPSASLEFPVRLPVRVSAKGDPLETLTGAADVSLEKPLLRGADDASEKFREELSTPVKRAQPAEEEGSLRAGSSAESGNAGVRLVITGGKSERRFGTVPADTASGEQQQGGQGILEPARNADVSVKGPSASPMQSDDGHEMEEGAENVEERGDERRSTESHEERDWSAWKDFVQGDTAVQIEKGIRASYSRAAAMGDYERKDWLDLMRAVRFGSGWAFLPGLDLSILELRYFALRETEGRNGFRGIKPAYPLVRQILATFLNELTGG